MHEKGRGSNHSNAGRQEPIRVSVYHHYTHRVLWNQVAIPAWRAASAKSPHALVDLLCAGIAFHLFQQAPCFFLVQRSARVAPEVHSTNRGMYYAHQRAALMPMLDGRGVPSQAQVMPLCGAKVQDIHYLCPIPGQHPMHDCQTTITGCVSNTRPCPHAHAMTHS